ncbi:Uncharacterised protein [Mycobacteroides abscessus subsp. massiliense]|nr:Uncharacterised protein [Mycobacteroides abscessus subsp. massiliense]
MAAVIATMLRCSLATSMSESENTDVQPGADALMERPVFGSMMPVECICSASSSSAGAYPIPLRVITCTMTGPPYPRARRNASSTACSSWPSTGPTYLMPRSVNITCGDTASLTPTLRLCINAYASGPTTGMPRSSFLLSSSTFSYEGVSRSPARCEASPPMVGA